MTQLLENFKENFIPFQNIVIDESLVLFKGRLAIKQYIPSKRHRFGIKLFVLCDSETGMVLDIIPYTATDTDIPANDPLGISGAVVKVMIERLLGKGHVIYMDNWYTSPDLSKFLLDHNTGSVGTVRKTRRNMPKFDSAKKIERFKTDDIMVMKWTDKRDVYLLTTEHKGELKETDKTNYRTGQKVKKPDVVIAYSENMGLVDKCDSQISMLECMRKSVKWYKKLFFHFLDLAVLQAYNSYLIHTGNRVKYRISSENLVYQLLESYATLAIPRSGRHLYEGQPDRLAAIAFVSHHYLQVTPVRANGLRSQKVCQVCMHTTKKPKKKKRVTTWCESCGVGLCLECFRDYHSLKQY